MKNHIIKHSILLSTLLVFFGLFTWLSLYLVNLPFFGEIYYPIVPVKDVLLTIVLIVGSMFFFYFLPVLLLVEMTHPLWIHFSINIEYPKRVYWIPKHKNIKIVSYKKLNVFLC